jgi:hypothetical protein
MAAQKTHQMSHKPRNRQFSTKQRAAIIKYHTANPRLSYERRMGPTRIQIGILPIQIIAKTAEIVEAKGGRDVDNVVQVLKRKQTDIRWDIMNERNEKEVQKRLDAHF